MQFITKDFTITLLKENIISLKVNADCTELTMEGAIQAMDKMGELTATERKPTKGIIYIAPFYVKKEILNYSTEFLPKPIAFVALVSPGYIAKYVGSIIIKIYYRFHKDDENQTEIKIFMKEDKAMEWLSSK